MENYKDSAQANQEDNSETCSQDAIISSSQDTINRCSRCSNCLASNSKIEVSKEKLFGKYTDFVLLLLGFLLTGIVGSYIAQKYATKNAELSAANKLFGEYGQLVGDRYFTQNQVYLGIKDSLPKEEFTARWNEYRSELQKWNTARGYNREMLKLYFGNTLWNDERNIHYSFRAWGQSLEAMTKEGSTAVLDFDCMNSKRDELLFSLYKFNYSLGEAIQKGKIGDSKAKEDIDINSRPKPICLVSE